MKIEKSFGTVFVDKEDLHHVCYGKNLMVNRGLLYVRIRNKKIVYAVHRAIMKAPVGMDVDHINGNRLDNRKTNLRVCTRSQNLRNRGPTKSSRSKYKGVTFKSDHWRKNPWVATAQIGEKYTFLGSFKTALEAAKHYDQVVFSHYGEFAWVNFPDDFPKRDQNKNS